MTDERMREALEYVASYLESVRDEPPNDNQKFPATIARMGLNRCIRLAREALSAPAPEATREEIEDIVKIACVKEANDAIEQRRDFNHTNCVRNGVEMALSAKLAGLVVPKGGED